MGGRLGLKPGQRCHSPLFSTAHASNRADGLLAGVMHLQATEAALVAAFEDKETDKVLVWTETPSNPLLKVRIMAMTYIPPRTAGQGLIHDRDLHSLTWMIRGLHSPHMMHGIIRVPASYRCSDREG